MPVWYAGDGEEEEGFRMQEESEAKKHVTKIWGHRGFSGRYPENTLLAFERALEMGVDGIELDVHRLADGQIVVMHDATAVRTTGVRRQLVDMNQEDVKQLDAGIWKGEQFSGQKVPVLDEVFRMLEKFPQATVNVEVKQQKDGEVYVDLVEDVWGKVEQHGLAERCIVSSFHHVELHEASGRLRNFAYGLLIHECLVAPWDYVSRVGATAFHPNFRTLDASVVDACHEHNLRVHAYTVNSREDAARLFEMGVDAVCTDYPDILLPLQKEYFRL